MSDDIDLRDSCIVRPADSFADFNGKGLGNGIDPFALIGMRTHQSGCMPAKQIDQVLILHLAHGVIDQHGCRETIA